VFVNEHKGTSDIFWVDHDGTEKQVAQIHARGRTTLETFVGHSFVARDEKTKVRYR